MAVFSAEQLGKRSTSRSWLALCAVCWVLFTSAASAQVLPDWMRVQRLFLTEGEAMMSSARAPHGAELATPAPADSGSSRADQSRARRILAVGAGFLLSAAITPAYVMPNREPCWGSDRGKGSGPLKVAAAVGAVGLAGVVSGATWLALEARRHGHHSSRRERIIATGFGALSFTLSQALLGSIFLVDQICNT